MEIFHLVYRSNATSEFPENFVQGVLPRAKKYNEEHGITGILIFRQRTFMQLIEGDQNEVKSLYARIKKDKRHERVFTLVEATSDQRIIEQWSMAFVEEHQARGSVQDLWSLFDSVIQGRTGDKNVIFPILKKFGGSIL